MDIYKKENTRQRTKSNRKKLFWTSYFGYRLHGFQFGKGILVKIKCGCCPFCGLPWTIIYPLYREFGCTWHGRIRITEHTRAIYLLIHLVIGICLESCFHFAMSHLMSSSLSACRENVQRSLVKRCILKDYYSHIESTMQCITTNYFFFILRKK